MKSTAITPSALSPLLFGYRVLEEVTGFHQRKSICHAWPLQTLLR